MVSDSLSLSLFRLFSRHYLPILFCLFLHINTFPSFHVGLHVCFFSSLPAFSFSFTHLHVCSIYFYNFGMHFCLSELLFVAATAFFSFHFICLIFLLDNIVVTVLYCYIAVAILSFRLLCTIVSIVIGCVCVFFFHYILFGICSIKLCAWCGLCFSHSPTHSFPLRLYLVQPGYAHTACINILSLTVYFS